MVHVVDNRTAITGTVLAVEGHPRLRGFCLVTLRLEKSEPVEDARDLLTSRRGQEILLSVRSRMLGSARPGTVLSCLAKSTVDGDMCVPGPTGEDNVELREA
ncbi:hypothetical protein [Kocuria sabuli]|uniref:hypothetical protein n=1 Tax=Kocuria sabuli TaxID=3071448 RepID=UPI0034D44609